jgi:excisionase family DNA binding protein
MKRSRPPVDAAPPSQRRRGGGTGEPAAHPVPPPAHEVLTEGIDGPLLIDSQEVARLLGIGRTKTFELMASGELPTIRLGRCVRVPVHALHSWIAGQTLPADE